LIGLVGASMVNNRVHWASDYPLAIGLGYLCAKQVVKQHRIVQSDASLAKKRRSSLNYYMSCVNGHFAPGVLVSF